MNDAEIFHQAMLNYGGRFDIDSDPRYGWWRSFKPLANEMISNTKSIVQRMPEVYFHFVANHQVQAYAFASQEIYFIGVYTGTVYILDTIFCRMLSDRRILPEIGTVQLEVTEPQSLTGLRMHAQETIAAGLRNSPPRCEARRLFKNRLTALAFHFLILHELTHIASGHVDFVARQLGVSLLAELGWTGKTESELLTRQSLEVMADTKAVMQLMGNMPEMCMNQTPPLVLEDAVFMLTFAICTFFRMFGDATFTDQELTREYPPLRLRQILCLHAADIVMESWPTSP